MSIGKNPETVDEEQPETSDVAEHLGIDLEDEEADDLPSVEEMWAVIQQLQQENEKQAERIDALEEENEELKQRVEETEETADDAVATSREIAASVNALKDDQEADSADGPEEASSPMDFFVNVQQAHVNQAISENRARAVQLVRRRDEWAKQDNKGRWYFDREAVREGLTAILGTRPHRETVHRVWRYIDAMSGEDIRRKEVKVSPSAPRREVLKLRPDADERYNEARYVGLNLLRGGSRQAGRAALEGGVTPVVTGAVA